MSASKFERLVAKRKRFVESLKENNFDFDSLLAGAYVDPSHFIYEILQNAEDAHAEEISFNLHHDRLEIFHNGDDFKFRNINGVTGIGISTKKDDLNAIGKFGVGFKSVYEITQTPIINSGEYHIRIDDFIVPSIVDSDGKVDNTRITLPFNHTTRYKDEVFELVRNKLENIDLKTLLFLSNIKDIKWQTPTNSGHYNKTYKSYDFSIDTQKVSITSKIEEEEYAEKYLVIRKPIYIKGKELKIEVAYRVGRDDNGNDAIIPVKDSKLVVFFPTERITYLNFLIQGRYKTTPNRENIPLHEEENKIIIKETGSLVGESISIIKELGLLNIAFLEVLPLIDNHPDDLIYNTIYHKVKEKFLSGEDLLPTNDGNYTSAKSSILADGGKLPEFLTEEDTEFLFEKQAWLDTNITDYSTRDLRNYLVKELEIKEIDFEYFAELVSAEFLARKSDDWLAGLYSELLDHRALWREGIYPRNAGVLRRRPIIRLSNNEHIEPCDSNWEIQVYLPTITKSKYKTVKANLIESQDALNFLKALGIKEPDVFAEINEFILPKYKNIKNDGDEEYFDDIEKFIIAYKDDSSSKKKAMISELKDLPIVRFFNPQTKEEGLKLPHEVYIMNPDLKEYFSGYDSANFASPELYNKIKDDALERFLVEAGCQVMPRRIQFEGDLSKQEREELRKKRDPNRSGLTREIHNLDYPILCINLFCSHNIKIISSCQQKFSL